MVPTMEQNYGENRYHKAIYAAKALGVSRITVYRYIKEGKLEAVRIGKSYYVSDRAFFRYLSEYRMPPGFQDGLKAILCRMRQHLHEAEIRIER